MARGCALENGCERSTTRFTTVGTGAAGEQPCLLESYSPLAPQPSAYAFFEASSGPGNPSAGEQNAPTLPELTRGLQPKRQTPSQ